LVKFNAVPYYHRGQPHIALKHARNPSRRNCYCPSRPSRTSHNFIYRMMPIVIYARTNIARPVNAVAMQDIYPWQVKLLRMKRDYIRPAMLVYELNILSWKILVLRVNYPANPAIFIYPVWGRVDVNLNSHGG